MSVVARVISLVCQHCGLHHPHGPDVCPRTGESMSEPGLCGRRVDRYQVERLLGQGGMGAVYRARHVVTDSVVALKVLKKGLASEPAVLDRFMREAKAAAGIGSAHVVRVLDAEVTRDGVAFIAMELLEGEDLQQISEREGILNPARVNLLMIQTLEALQAAHLAGVVHRDMKPANVFVVRQTGDDGIEREEARLLDFGISKMASGLKLTVAGITMGTPAYMAYEQFFDARDVDARTDVYSVAAMAYQLLSGRKPYEFSSFTDLVEQIRTVLPPPLRTVAPRLPVPLCAIVDKGLQRKRERRWQSAIEFADALRGLERLLGPIPPLAPPPELSVDPETDRGTLIRADDETVRDLK